MKKSSLKHLTSSITVNTSSTNMLPTAAKCFGTKVWRNCNLPPSLEMKCWKIVTLLLELPVLLYPHSGLRYVKPYYFTFTTYAKGDGWDVLCTMFSAGNSNLKHQNSTYVGSLQLLVVVAVENHSVWLSRQERALQAGKITGKRTNRVIGRQIIGR